MYDLDVCCLMYLIYRIYVHDFGLINVWNPMSPANDLVLCAAHLDEDYNTFKTPSPPLGSQFQPFCLNSYTAPGGCSALLKNRRVEMLKK